MRTLIRPALFALWSTALVASVSNLIVLFAGQAANGASVFVDLQGMTLDVDPVTVIFATIAGALMAAVGSLIAMRLLARRGPLVIIIAGSVLALLSLFGTSAATTTTGVVTLAIMHLVTGTVVVVGNVVIHSRAKDRAAVSTR